LINAFSHPTNSFSITPFHFLLLLLLACLQEHLYWKELSAEQRAAAAYFGYSQNLWDETGVEETVFGGDDASATAAAGPKKEAEEKKDDGDETTKITAAVQEIGLEDDSSEEEAEEAAGKKKTDSDKKKVKKTNNFRWSRAFGSADIGTMFDHSNHRHIDEIHVYYDKHVIHGMTVTYSGGAVKKAGESTKGREEIFKFAANEYINAVKVRSNKYVQSLSFQTTTNRWVGPVGGKGWLIGGDKCGEEIVVKPFNKVLSGMKGRADDSHLCQIVFSWGPIPK
jgi:Jacalin-like lectin domain